MEQQDWTVLLGRIKEGKCTPFLGAGVNYGLLPLGGHVAKEWAKAEEFPLLSSDDLASVAQYIAVKYNDAVRPKDEMLKLLGKEAKPDFLHPDDRLECLRALADLPLPIYLTTNYDGFMVEALKNAKKEPRREVCKWHAGLKSLPSVFGAASKYKPDHANPVVFHLHGSDQYVESLVLTEDDYLDFLVNISRNQRILPPRIQEALTNASLLFIGYRLRDINFRVIYRGLVQSMEGSLRRLSVTVQMRPPEDHSGDPIAAEEYLNRYFGDLKVTVYWGTATQFAKDLRDKWQGFAH